MCSGPRGPSIYRRNQSPQPNTKSPGNTIGRVDNTQKPYRDQLPPAPTKGMQFRQDAAADIVEYVNSERTNQKQSEPKMRTIRKGTTVRGQQTTQSAAPSRRRRQSARMGRRSGTSSLRIARNPNTGSGNLNY